MTLKEIALEILGKYRDSEISAIYEKYCGSIDKDLDDLSAEIDRYTRQIEIMDMQNRGVWIPVTERLPGSGEDVLLSIVGGSIDVGFLAQGSDDGPCIWFYSDWYHPFSEVDAWMPLPDPYKEEQE